MDTIKIYVGTYGKYNSGSLYGEWLDLADYNNVEEFYVACAELHSSEHDPEFMFQDIEDDFGFADQFISECSIENEVFEVLDKIDSNEIDGEAFAAWIAGGSGRDWENFEDKYIGYLGNYTGSTASQIAELFVDLGYIEIPDHIRFYFDWEKYGYDLMIEHDVCGDYVFSY